LLHTHTRPVIVDGAWVTAATLVETSNAAMIFINAPLTTLNLIVAVFLNVERSLRISKECGARVTGSLGRECILVLNC